MKLTKKLESNKSKQKEVTGTICIHCHKKIIVAKLIGLSLVCPFCNKPSDELYDIKY